MSSLVTDRRAILRVTTGDPEGRLRFDAMVILSSRARLETRLLVDEWTPFELELPDQDCTIVARSHEPGARLTVEYIVERGGIERLRGRSRHPIAVLERRRAGIVAGGLVVPPWIGG